MRIEYSIKLNKNTKKRVLKLILWYQFSNIKGLSKNSISTKPRENSWNFMYLIVRALTMSKNNSFIIFFYLMKSVMLNLQCIIDVYRNLKWKLMRFLFMRDHYWSNYHPSLSLSLCYTGTNVALHVLQPLSRCFSCLINLTTYRTLNFLKFNMSLYENNCIVL